MRCCHHVESLIESLTETKQQNSAEIHFDPKAPRWLLQLNFSFILTSQQNSISCNTLNSANSLFLEFICEINRNCLSYPQRKMKRL